jgi:hypothetical protein
MHWRSIISSSLGVSNGVHVSASHAETSHRAVQRLHDTPTEPQIRHTHLLEHSSLRCREGLAAVRALHGAELAGRGGSPEQAGTACSSVSSVSSVVVHTQQLLRCLNDTARETELNACPQGQRASMQRTRTRSALRTFRAGPANAHAALCCREMIRLRQK